MTFKADKKGFVDLSFVNCIQFFSDGSDIFLLNFHLDFLLFRQVLMADSDIIRCYESNREDFP